MSRWQKFCFFMFFFLMFGLPFLSTILSNIDLEESTGFNDYARITDLNYRAIVLDQPGQGGNVLVEERITFDIHAASKNNLFWELWRDLPEDTVDGLKVDYDVLHVSQVNDHGPDRVYEESPKLYWDDSDYTSSTYGPYKWYHSPGPYNEYLNRYECVFFYVNGLYREEVTFQLIYIIHNAALKYNDTSELYLSMYSEDSIKYLESFHGEIIFPNEDMPKKGNYLFHTFGTNSNTFEVKESDTLYPGFHTFSFDLDEDDLKFSPYNQYLEFTLLSFNEDRHIFTENAPDNYYSDSDYLEEAKAALDQYDQEYIDAKNNQKIVLCLSILASFLLLYYTIRRDRKIRKRHQFYQPTTKINYFREIPSDLDPVFAARLVFLNKKRKPKDGDGYSALLLSLIRKGYIELQRIDPNKDWKTNNMQLNVLYNPLAGKTINTSPTPTIAVESKPIEEKTGIPNQTTVSVTPPVERYNIYGKKLELLTTNEEHYFNLIMRHSFGKPISMSQFEQQVASDYDHTNSFVSSISKSTVDIGISKGYFQKVLFDRLKNHANSTAKMWIILSILIMTLGNYLLHFTRLDLAYGSLFILGISMILCAIYLKHCSKHYILFTQFGIDEYEKWKGLYHFLNDMTRMKEKTVIELPLWEKYLVYATAFGISDKVIKALKINCPDVAASPVLSNQYIYRGTFRTSGRTFSHSVYRASSVSRSHSYRSGSFYGGGGRGGGGGGGGH